MPKERRPPTPRRRTALLAPLPVSPTATCPPSQARPAARLRRPISIWLCMPISIWLCTPTGIGLRTPTGIWLCHRNGRRLCRRNGDWLCPPSGIWLCPPHRIWLCPPGGILDHQMARWANGLAVARGQRRRVVGQRSDGRWSAGAAPSPPLVFAPPPVLSNGAVGRGRDWHPRALHRPLDGTTHTPAATPSPNPAATRATSPSPTPAHATRLRSPQRYSPPERSFPRHAPCGSGRRCRLELGPNIERRRDQWGGGRFAQPQQGGTHGQDVVAGGRASGGGLTGDQCRSLSQCERVAHAVGGQI